MFACSSVGLLIWGNRRKSCLCLACRLQIMKLGGLKQL
jgi:hypothetical protein